MNQKLWGWGPALFVLISQSGDSDAHYSFRIYTELWEQLITLFLSFKCFYHDTGLCHLREVRKWKVASDLGAVLAFTAWPGVDHNTTEHPWSRPLCDDKKQDHSVIMSEHRQKQELTTKITEIFSNLANAWMAFALCQIKLYTPLIPAHFQ